MNLSTLIGLKPLPCSRGDDVDEGGMMPSRRIRVIGKGNKPSSVCTCAAAVGYVNLQPSAAQLLARIAINASGAAKLVAFIWQLPTEAPPQRTVAK